MQDQLIAVVDGVRARFFTAGARTTPSGEEKNKLDEVETLINPAHRIKDAETYPNHGVDDRRDSHTDEIDRKFAKLVLERMTELIRQHNVLSVILAAGPRMLGHLRDRGTSIPGVVVGELSKHLTELSAHELCLRLEADDLI